METTNPYRTPIADVTAPTGQGLDHTRPFDPSGRFGRLSYIAWVMLVNVFFGLYLLLKPGTDGANRFGPPRQTVGWEKVVGAIGIGLILLSLLAMIGLLIALSMNPELMQQWQQALQAA